MPVSALGNSANVVSKDSVPSFDFFMSESHVMVEGFGITDDGKAR